MILRETYSLCPECYKKIPAKVVAKNGKVFLQKECPEHGFYEELYYGDLEIYKRFESFDDEPKNKLENPNFDKENTKNECPFNCGLCYRHKSHTALANVVVTNRCNLKCWYCFFYAEKVGYVYEPTLEEFKKMAEMLKNQRPVACNAIQLTGGEPTLREDLAEIVKIFKEANFEHIQLNTTGIKLAEDLELCKKLSDAGVTTLYVSFDGVTPKTNPKNHFAIPKLIENCRKSNIGIVLVPTVIKTVNDHELGDIIKFGFENLPIVKGVNFQPVSLVGRMPKEEREKYRITIPDALKLIEEQTSGAILVEDFYPIPAMLCFTRLIDAITGFKHYELGSHFACGAATYVFRDEKSKKLVPITRFVDVDAMIEFFSEFYKEIEKEKNIGKAIAIGKAVAKLKSFIDFSKMPSQLKLDKVLAAVLEERSYKALGRFHDQALFIGMMHFMDTYNYDVQRVQRCCIHYVTPDMRVIPFCTFNVMPHLYRDKIHEKYGKPLEK